jgi:methionyl aminopeptidase
VHWTQRIRLKSPREVELMAAAGRDLVTVFLRLREGMVRVGVTTGELDRMIEQWIRDLGCTPSFKGYHGFPASSCISVNEEVVHGIPGGRVLQDGDIVGIDIGLIKSGYHADSAETFLLGKVTPAAVRLCETTKAALADGLAACREGNRISDIGRAIERRARERKYGVVEVLVGHGIGTEMHEDPQVPNYVCPTMPDPKLEVGMVLALEPMFNLGTKEVYTLPDEWTVVTADGKLSAHYEHTVAITTEGPRVLTDR